MAWAPKGGGGWPACGEMGGVSASSEMGRSDSPRRAFISLHHGTCLFFTLGGVGNADLDGRCAIGERDIETLATFDIRYFLSGLRRLCRDD